jgi:hypothetical protein
LQWYYPKQYPIDSVRLYTSRIPRGDSEDWEKYYMNGTKRVAAIGLLCIGTSALSFGDFQPFVGDWDGTYNPNTALFSALIQQDGASLDAGLPTVTSPGGPSFVTTADDTFSLTYTSGASSGLATLTILAPDNSVLDNLSVPTPLVALAGGSLDHIGIALSAGSDEETITLSNLILNGTDSPSPLTTTGSALDFEMAPPAALSAFTLTGDITMTWTDAAPQLSAEIIGADSFGPPAPEPGTWALLGSALVSLGLLRRKRIV